MRPTVLEYISGKLLTTTGTPSWSILTAQKGMQSDTLVTQMAVSFLFHKLLFKPLLNIQAGVGPIVLESNPGEYTHDISTHCELINMLTLSHTCKPDASRVWQLIEKRILDSIENPRALLEGHASIVPGAPLGPLSFSKSGTLGTGLAIASWSITRGYLGQGHTVPTLTGTELADRLDEEVRFQAENPKADFTSAVRYTALKISSYDEILKLMKRALQSILVVLVRRAKNYLKGGAVDISTMTAADKAATKGSLVTNDASERVFGIQDYLQNRFTTLSDRAMSATAMSKINGMWLWLTKLGNRESMTLWREVSSHKAVTTRLENDRNYLAQVEKRRAEKFEEDKAEALRKKAKRDAKLAEADKVLLVTNEIIIDDVLGRMPTKKAKREYLASQLRKYSLVHNMKWIRFSLTRAVDDLRGQLSKVIQCLVEHFTLHYITLHYITLHHITSHHITLHYITLHYKYYITLHHITLYYITLHYITLHYNVVLIMHTSLQSYMSCPCCMMHTFHIKSQIKIIYFYTGYSRVPG